MGSHMEIASRDLEASKDVVYYDSYVHSSNRYRESFGCSMPMCYGLRFCCNLIDISLAL